MKYFVSLCCTDTEIALLPSAEATAGIDTGIGASAAASDGAEYSEYRHPVRNHKPSQTVAGAGRGEFCISPAGWVTPEHERPGMPYKAPPVQVIGGVCRITEPSAAA